MWFLPSATPTARAPPLTPNDAATAEASPSDVIADVSLACSVILPSTVTCVPKVTSESGVMSPTTG